jgi:DNA-binding PadR family transcriptional regulator
MAGRARASGTSRTRRVEEPPVERFLPLGNLPFHVLLALGEGAAHGYAIGKEIELRSGGALDPTTGALYQVLKRLTEDGFVEAVAEAPEPTADARRRYFQLTPLGRRVAAAEAARLERLVAAARQKNLYPASA